MVRAVTPEVIAERVACTPAHIRDLCAKGIIRARKLGKYWRIEEVDFEAWWKSLPVTKPIDNAAVIDIAERRR